MDLISLSCKEIVVIVGCYHLPSFNDCCKNSSTRTGIRDSPTFSIIAAKIKVLEIKVQDRCKHYSARTVKRDLPILCEARRRLDCSTNTDQLQQHKYEYGFFVSKLLSVSPMLTRMTQFKQCGSCASHNRVIRNVWNQ